MKRMPKEIRILGQKYRIRIVKNLKYEGGVAYGVVNHRKHIIYLNAACRLDFKMCTLLHEVIHALVERLDVPLSERGTRVLGEGIFTVLVDNGFIKIG